jgi:hypothetical protein
MIPKPVAAVVGKELGTYYASHRRIEELFLRAGAPGGPPKGNCVEKTVAWLLNCSETPQVDDLEILGVVLRDFMEVVSPFDKSSHKREMGRARIRTMLARHGLIYHQGGSIVSATLGMPSRSLESLLRKRSVPALDIEFERAALTIERDPPISITAACAILESLCRIFIAHGGDKFHPSFRSPIFHAGKRFPVTSRADKVTFFASLLRLFLQIFRSKRTVVSIFDDPFRCSPKESGRKVPLCGIPLILIVDGCGERASKSTI